VTQPSTTRKIFDWITGLSLIFLGTAGLVLPVLPGVLLVIGGIAILSSHSSIARRIHSAMIDRAKRVRDRVMKRE
jgi:uncharacterized protein YqgC (DUF456 family)